MNIGKIQEELVPQIMRLLKKEPEAISSVEKTEDGWAIECEVLEKKAVPETFDLLKVFEFRLDKLGRVTGFKQLRKVRRGDLG